MILDKKIEEKILKYIKSDLSDNEILKKDNSFPIYYTFSKNRENILNWYPFKKDCSILEVNGEFGSLTPLLCQKSKELVTFAKDKTQEEIILKRCKEYKNIDIIKSLKINKKFDYIVLIGTLDYLENLRKLLKPNGKILLSIDNRFALKYWCGAKDEVNGEIFSTLNNNSSLKLFSKNELEEKFNNLNLKYNFYYPFPDYRFPEIILTDEILKNNIKHSYNPYYMSKTNVIIKEKDLFDDILKNNQLPFFANSYFVELSDKESPVKIEYVKFNNYRYPEYATITYKKENKYYKKAIYENGIDHIKNITKYYSILSSHNVKAVKVVEDKNECYTTNIKSCYSLMDKLNELYLNNKIKEIYSEINKYINYLKKHFKQEKDVKNTIFDKYKISISKETLNKMFIVKDGFIDLCFQNLLIDNNDYMAIDQEWYFENVPLEYIIYRSIHLFVFNNMDIKNKSELFKNILENISINIDEYIDLFDKLEDKFIYNVINYDHERITYDKYLYAFNSNDISKSITDAIENYDLYVQCKKDNKLKNDLINNQQKEIDKMIKLVHDKDEQYINLGNNYNSLEKSNACLNEENKKLNEQNVNLSKELSRINNSFWFKVIRKLHLRKK